MTEDQQTNAKLVPQDIWVPAIREAGVAFLASAFLLAIFYVFAFRWIHPEFVAFMGREATQLIAPGKDLIPVSVGGYRVEGSSAIIEDFNGDEAILALPRSFQAEDYPFIKVNLEGITRYSRLKILWRRAENPSQTHALELNRSGRSVTQIAMVYDQQNYRGLILDIALLFYDGPALGVENNNGVDVLLKSIELRPFSALRVVEQILEDWTNVPLWQGYSSNIVRGIHANGMLYPNIVSNLLIITSFAMVWILILIHRVKKFTLAPHKILAFTMCLFLYGWGFNEAIRWQWRSEQLLDTYDRYGGLTLEEKIVRSRLRCSRDNDDCKSDLLPYF